MWRDLIRTLSNEHELRPPASIASLLAAERALGVALPDALRALLLDSDGVKGEHGLDVVWPLDRIVSDNTSFRSNRDFRELYMPFDALLFFGDGGCGSQFAFAVLDGVVRRSDVYEWDHENVSRTWVAASLQRHLEQVLAG